MKRTPENILVLHGLGPKKYRLSSVEEVDTMFANRIEEANYFSHDLHLPLPNNLEKIEFDLIFVSSTFIAKIAHPKFLRKIERDYAFLKSKYSLVVAFPQDDYWCQQERDHWYTNYVDVLVSVFDQSQWNLLYPQYLKTKKPILRGHTVYLTDKLISKCQLYRNANKEFDIVYRTRGAPSFPNKLGDIKYKLGDLFLNKLTRNLNLNFSNKSVDILFGDDWLKFLSKSKAVLGSNSGSSVIVENHQHMLEIKRALIKGHRSSKNSEVIKNLISQEHFLTDISPRNIEAALLGTLQILLPGPYGGILEPGRDYIELKDDFSNVNTIVEILEDAIKVNTIIENCRNTILNDKTLKIKTLEIEILNYLTPQTKKNSSLSFAGIWYIKMHRFIFNFILTIKYDIFYMIKNYFPSKLFNIIRKKYFKL